MAQVIALICDRHLEDNIEVPDAMSFVVSIGLAGPGEQQVVDLCAECQKELIEELMALLQNHGRPYDAPEVYHQDSDDYGCPRCGYVARSKGGLSQHAGYAHSTTLAALIGDEPDQGRLVCPAPDCTYRSASRTGLMTHSKTHDTTLSQLEAEFGPVRHEHEPAAKVDQRTLAKRSVRDGHVYCRKCNKDLGAATPGHRWYCDDCRTPKQKRDAKRKENERAKAKKGAKA